MKRSVLSQRLLRRFLGVALAVSLLGSVLATAEHGHRAGSDHPQSCAICHVAHQPVQAMDAVLLPEPALPRAVPSATAGSVAPAIAGLFHPYSSRAPPA